MMSLACDVLRALAGKTLATAESCTGGGIGAVLTGVPGSSAVYKGGIICYTNQVKSQLLGVETALLESCGAVSAPVAEAMVRGVQTLLKTDTAISVTGLAGPDGDDLGNPVGTVFIGCAVDSCVEVQIYHFPGDRECVREAAVTAALELMLKMLKKCQT